VAAKALPALNLKAVSIPLSILIPRSKRKSHTSLSKRRMKSLREI